MNAIVLFVRVVWKVMKFIFVGGVEVCDVVLMYCEVEAK